MATETITEKEKTNIVSQVKETMERRGIKSAIVRYSQDEGRVLTLEDALTYDADKGKNYPQSTFDVRHDPYSPFLVIPRLAELRNWIVFPTKSTNIALYNGDGVVQNLIDQFIGMVRGDGTTITIYDEDLKGEDELYTNFAREWSRKAGGKNRSLDSYVIPWWVIDNMTTGYSVFAKYFGREDDMMVEPGDMALVHLDPRLYAPVGHDTRLWRKIVMYPIKQSQMPDSRTGFDKWVPSMRGPYAPYSSSGMVDWTKPIELPYNTYYDCMLWLGKAPLSTIVSEMISTIELRFYRNKAFEKTAFPIILIRVARHSERDQNDAKFLDKLQSASSMGAEFRNGESIAIEGKEYDGDGQVISEGWEVQVLDVKTPTMDFTNAFRLIDEQKAYGLRMSMALLTTTGLEGQKHSLTGGANVMESVSIPVKAVRSQIRDIIQNILNDLIFLHFDDELDINRIDVQFGESRERDVAGFSGMLFQAFDRNIVSMEETRQNLRRVGLPLEFKSEDELLDEMSERMQAQQGMEGMEGMEEGMEGAEGMEGEMPGMEGASEMEESDEEFAGEEVEDESVPMDKLQELEQMFVDEEFRQNLMASLGVPSGEEELPEEEIGEESVAKREEVRGGKLRTRKAVEEEE